MSKSNKKKTKHQPPLPKKIQIDTKTDNKQLRIDLTKVVMLTMLAVGLELALSYLLK